MQNPELRLQLARARTGPEIFCVWLEPEHLPLFWSDSHEELEAFITAAQPRLDDLTKTRHSGALELYLLIKEIIDDSKKALEHQRQHTHRIELPPGFGAAPRD